MSPPGSAFSVPECYFQLETPPCPEQAPARFFECEYVPSLHFAVARAFTLFDAPSFATADLGDALATAVGEAIGVALDGFTVGAAVVVFCTDAVVFALADAFVDAGFVAAALVTAGLAAAVACACTDGAAMEIAAAAIAPAINPRIAPFIVLLPRRILGRADRSPPSNGSRPKLDAPDANLESQPVSPITNRSRRSRPRRSHRGTPRTGTSATIVARTAIHGRVRALEILYLLQERPVDRSHHRAHFARDLLGRLVFAVIFANYVTVRAADTE